MKKWVLFLIVLILMLAAGIVVFQISDSDSIPEGSDHEEGSTATEEYCKGYCSLGFQDAYEESFTEAEQEIVGKANCEDLIGEPWDTCSEA